MLQFLWPVDLASCLVLLAGNAWSELYAFCQAVEPPAAKRHLANTNSAKAGKPAISVLALRGCTAILYMLLRCLALSRCGCTLENRF